MQCEAVLNDRDPDVARGWCASLDVSTVRGTRGMSEYYSDYSESASVMDCEPQSTDTCDAHTIWFKLV